MRILIDATVCTNTFQLGIQRCVTELVKNLSVDYAFMHHSVAGLRMDADLQSHVLPGYESRLPQRNFLRRTWLAWQRQRALHAKTFSVYHTPYLGMCPIAGLPSVMVVNDMVCEMFPEQFHGDAKLESERKKQAIDKATLLLAISQATADDLARIHPSTCDRIRVVHPGRGHIQAYQASAQKPEGADFDFPYVLFVGDRKGYKNFHLLLEAMTLATWPDGLELVVVGPAPSEAELADCAQRNLVAKTHFTGRVDDATLAALYHGAACFVFPSRHEGYGFPLIEAQSQATPVVASDIPVFQEIGGEAFEKFSPGDAGDLARAVASATAPARRVELLELGTRNAARFSWQATAAKTLAVWQEAAQMK